MLELEGQSAGVTGATGGIGKSVALALARKGVRLHLLVRDAAKGRQLASDLVDLAPSARFDVHELDLCGDIRSAVELVLKDIPAVDILVHAAGALRLVRFADLDERDVDLQFQINARAPLVLTKLLLPHLRKRPGHPPHRRRGLRSSRARPSPARGD